MMIKMIMIIMMIMMMRVITIVMIAMNKDADDLFLANILIAHR